MRISACFWHCCPSFCGQPSHLTCRSCVRVDRRGVEPRLPGCKPGVFPLDEQPVPSSLQEVRPGIEPGLPPYHSGVPPKHLQTILTSAQVTPDGVEPSSPACHAGVVAVGPRSRIVSDRGGSRTGHRPEGGQVTRLSTSSLCLFAYPAVLLKLAGPGVAPGYRGL